MSFPFHPIPKSMSLITDALSWTRSTWKLVTASVFVRGSRAVYEEFGLLLNDFKEGLGKQAA